MGLMSGFKSLFVGDDDLEQEDEFDSIYDTNDSFVNPSNSDGRNREVKIAATTTLQIVLTRPSDFGEVKSDEINQQKTVLLNLETVKSEDAKRILDFISGVAYANGAVIKMMAQKTFAIMPHNVSFQGVDLMSELENNGYSF